MARRDKPKNATDALTGFMTGLRQARNRPTIYGYLPMEKQEIFHKSTAKGKQYLGGNRSGKTVGGATECCWWLIGNHPFRETPKPPVRGRCVSVDFLNGVEKIVKPEISRWIPRSELAGGSWETAYDKELRTLHLKNDSFLEFMSYDQDLDKFAGTSRHFVWFDEEPPHSIFTECRTRLIDTGGSWWMTMTPVEGMTWTYDDIFVASQGDPNLLVITTSMDDNVHLNPGEIESFISGLDDDEREARRHGRYVAMGGLIYKMFRADKHIKPEIINSAFWPHFKSDWVHFQAMDHGYNNPTAWLFMAADKDGRIVVYDELYDSRRVVEEWAQVVSQKVRSLGIDSAYAVGDPSIRNTDPITGTSVQIEYAKNGVSIIPGNNDVDIGINLVASLLNTDPPRLFITRNCVNLIREFNKYRWATWASAKSRDEQNAKEKPHKKDDHAMDALRYGVASQPMFEATVEERKRYPGIAGPDATYHEDGKHVFTDPAFAYARREQGEYAEQTDSYLGAEY